MLTFPHLQLSSLAFLEVEHAGKTSNHEPHSYTENSQINL